MKCHYGHITLKDGGGRMERRTVIIEIQNDTDRESWVYLTRNQAKKIGKLLTDFAKSKGFYKDK